MRLWDPDQDPNLGLESIDADLWGHRHVLLLVVGRGAREDAWADDAAIALARGLSEQGKRVVLADLDFGEPALHARLGVPNAEGMSDVFLFGASLEHVVLTVADRPFALIPAGVGVTDPRVVLEHPGWTPILSRIEADREAAGDLLLAFVPAEAPGLDALARSVGAAIALGLDHECAAIATGLPAGVPVLAAFAPAALAPAAFAPAALAPAIEVGEEMRVPGPIVDAPREPVPADVSASDEPSVAPRDEPGAASLRRLAPGLRARAKINSRNSRPDLGQIGPIRRSKTGGVAVATLRILRLRSGPRWPEDGMRKREVIFARVLSEVSRLRLARGLTVAAVLLLSVLVGIWHFGVRPVPSANGAIELPAAVAQTPPAGTPATPTSRAAGELLPYTVAVELHAEMAEATRRVESLEREAPTVDFFITPVVVDDAVAYRVLAGPVRDSTAAAELMDWLVEKGHTGRSEWGIRARPYAFLLGEYDRREQADARKAELAERDIPSYVLEMPYAGVTPSRYLLYAGAYSGAAEAELMRLLLLDEGLSDSLVERKGRLPQ